MVRLKSRSILFTAFTLLFLTSGFAFGTSTDSFTVTEDGNVGIGVSDPSFPLHAVSSYNGPTAVIYNSSSLGVNNGILQIQSYNGPNSNFALMNLLYNADGTTGGGPYSHSALYVRGDGYIGMGTTSPSGMLDIYNTGGYKKFLSITNTSPNYDKLLYLNGTNAGSATYFIYAENASSDGVKFLVRGDGLVGIGTANPQYALDVNGYIRATGFGPVSDARLKDNVSPISNALDRTLQLQGVNFQWKDKSRGEGPQVGLIAQDVEKIFPEVVSTDSEGIKSVSYMSLVAPLVESVKALKTENNNLRSEAAELRSETASLRARLDALEKKMK